MTFSPLAYEYITGYAADPAGYLDGLDQLIAGAAAASAASGRRRVLLGSCDAGQTQCGGGAFNQLPVTANGCGGTPPAGFWGPPLATFNGALQGTLSVFQNQGFTPCCDAHDIGERERAVRFLVHARPR